MTSYPISIDDDSSIIRVDGNITELGDISINQIRSAIFAIETELGLGGSGSIGSVAMRIAVSINADGTLKPSSITSAGALVGPIADAQVSNTAAITESKINLTYSTQSLYNSIQTLSTNLASALVLFTNLSSDFTKHLFGVNPLSNANNSRHAVSQIDLNIEASDQRDVAYAWPNGGQRGIGTLPRAPRDRFGALRGGNGGNLANFLSDLNADLVRHELADGLAHTDGYNFADQYSHAAASVLLDTSGFLIIPQTANDVQKFSNFVDKTTFVAVTNHQQDDHTNGIPRSYRGSILTADGYGQPVVSLTNVTTYLLNTDLASSPQDNNTTGDDVIEFLPTTNTSFGFDTQFAQVKAGQIITVQYGSVQVSYIIDSVNYTFTDDGLGNVVAKYLVRINGRNLMYSTTAKARIDQPLFSDAKFGVLALAGVNNAFGSLGSLVVSNPRSASALGLGFQASKFDSNHFKLYLQLYPTGNPIEKQYVLPAIDVTGNAGATPGKYTIDSIVEATNNAFHKAGFNYRFTAFNYNGEFGIMLSDAVNNASFSIISGSVGSNGTVSSGVFTKNVIGDADPNGPDPLGFGKGGSAIASPTYTGSFPTIGAAQKSTIIFVPFKNKNYYVNGIPKGNLFAPPDTILDGYGDRYYNGTITAKTVFPGVTVKTTYVVSADLSKNNIQPGKTILVQPALAIGAAGYSDSDYGRFIIDSVSYDDDSVPMTTTIRVYNGIHAIGVPVASGGNNIPVKLYFSDDSVGFNKLNIINTTSPDNFKRYIEAYIDTSGHTFTHERARFDLSTSNTLISNINIVKVSPKLRGYNGLTNKFININITSYDSNGNYTGYLSNTAGLNPGPVASGKKGTVTRFYDETNVDFIDCVFNVDDVIIPFGPISMSIDLFPSLQLDQEVFYLGSCQVNDLTTLITYLRDGRTFGNISEKEFSTSALDYVSVGPRNTVQNGVVRGFDSNASVVANLFSFNGGTALVDGKFITYNSFTAAIPYVQDFTTGSPVVGVLWAVCANSSNEIQLIPLTDFDATVNSINNPTRGMVLYNPITTTSYNVESSTFSTVLNRRKDLAILYTVKALVTGVGTGTFTLFDSRRFINDTNSNDYIVLSSDVSQGSHRTFASAVNWLKYNSGFQNTVVVRGAYTIASDPGLNTATPVILKGDGAASITFNVTTSVSNVTFENINLIIPLGVTVNLGAGCSVINCTVTAGSAKAFLLQGDRIVFRNNTFNWTYNPVGDGTYVAADWANNTGNGLITCISSYTAVYKIHNIENNIFNFTLPDHYTAIGYQLTLDTSVFESVSIRGNKFLSVSATDDLRACIAFTSTLTAASPGGDVSKSPKMVNCVIEDNLCTLNQMILVTATRLAAGNINNGLAAINVRIVGNTCGTIGYFTVPNNPTQASNANVAGAIVYDKTDKLLIESNTCKYIACLDYQGRYIPFRSVAYPAGTTNWVAVDTGPVAISRNTCNWIHIGTLGVTDGCGAVMNGNSLHSNNPAYLSNFTDTGSSSITPPNIAIVLRCGVAAVDASYSYVTGNSISSRKTVNGAGALSTVYYDQGLACFVGAQIDGNNFYNCISANTASFVYLWSGMKSAIITNNNFNRNSQTIQAYIAGDTTLGNNYVNITDNIFDSSTVDGVTNENLIINPGTAWIYERNKNQTKSLTISLTASDSAFDSGLLNIIQPVTATADPAYYMVSTALLNSTLGGIYLLWHESSSTAQRSLQFNYNLNQMLPTSVRVLDAKMGVYATSTGGTFDYTGKTAFLLQIERAISNESSIDAKASYLASITGQDTGLANSAQSSAYGVSDAAHVTAISTATQYVEVDLTNISGNDYSNLYVTSGNFNIILSVYLLSKSSIAGNWEFVFSPIRIKYRW